MIESTRPLPQQDLITLFGLVVTVENWLRQEELPAPLPDELGQHLEERGVLAVGASTGELVAVLADVAQRLHYAMGAGEELPEPMPRETHYSLYVPTEAAALACKETAYGWGSTEVLIRARDFDQRRDIEPYRRDLGWEVLAAFPSLEPDPAHRDNEARLAVLAHAHDGVFSGHQQ
ncbi:hypothetical protein EV385_3114 [Krasilnikovia cinnamomea]|uniref:Uncharacterized protein n=1 Tax=Krasilnikovia cinnamomea TaxID=349313 RepID=A0A4Q7ZL46_9ACTN|nr:hypothetical protein [Krasilnikovia cinnamomea]RZU51301.1 hypothetical protein EV385_3114 [Krasilnikovia cinnamomea]